MLSTRRFFIVREMDMLSGFGNHHETEAVRGTLPKGQNSPAPFLQGLYAEQISGSAFTRPRHQNFKTWVYRITPSVVYDAFEPYPHSADFETLSPIPPNPLRWSPIGNIKAACDWLDALYPIARNEQAIIYSYHCTQNMTSRIFGNSDGEMLFIPVQAELEIFTELGRLLVKPGHIAVIPRGIRFRVSFEGSNAQGYVCENQGLPFSLPCLGPIGANGLANPRHFLYPTAAFEDKTEPVEWVNKYQGCFWHTSLQHSPLDVVAWHGNYAPYSYDLSLFNTINTVSFDHPDPSIFTVLTSESALAGVANLDFAIFPARWMVALHSFRPPYFHRNVMSEFMGLIHGQYDAKVEGFVPGGASIHNALVPHGPDTDTVQQQIEGKTEPEYFDGGLAFMLESCHLWKPIVAAYHHPARQKQYQQCWQNMPRYFQK